MIDHFVVGGFYRVHTERGTMKISTHRHAFRALAFVEPCNTPDRTREPDAEPNRSTPTRDRPTAMLARCRATRRTQRPIGTAMLRLASSWTRSVDQGQKGQ